MKTHRIVISVIVGIFLLCAAYAFGNGTSENTTKSKTYKLGYIMPGPDPWYKYARDGFLFAAQKHGVKVVVLNSNYDQQKELNNVQDLIAQNVDGIDIFSFNPDGVQKAAKLANQAGIPLLAEMSTVGKGSGKVICDVEFDWYNLGVTIAKDIAKLNPGARVLEITGIIGQGPVDQYLKGLKDEVKTLGKNTLVSIQPADYNREKAMNVMQNMLQSGKQFTVVHVGNEDMAMGVIRVLKEAGKLNNPIRVISNNGSPEGLQAIKAGDLEATISTSPGVEGLVCFEALYRYLQHKNIPAKIMIPMIPIDKSNVDTAVSWTVDDNAYAMVQKMFDNLGAK